MKRQLQQITCQLCGECHPSNGIHTHLKYKHGGMTTKQYIEKFGDFRMNTKIAEKLKDGKTLYKCLICGDDKTYSTTALSFHIIKQHKSDKSSYITKYLLDEKLPTCKCGCGKLMDIKSYSPPYTTEYASGHNKSTLGYKFSDASKQLMSIVATNNINLAKQAWIDVNNEVRVLFAQAPPAIPPAPPVNTAPPQQGGSMQIEDVKSGEDKGPTLIRGILTQEA